MSTFEGAGRVIDKELEKLKHFFETEVKPTTKRRAVEALRTASAKLSKLASKLGGKPSSKKKKKTPR